MLDGDTLAENTVISATSSLPGTSPKDALLSSEKPDSYWSSTSDDSDTPVLTVDVTPDDTTATVSKVEFTVDSVSAVEIVINTPAGPSTPVRI